MSDHPKIVEDIISLGLKIAVKGKLNDDDGHAIAKLAIAYNITPKPAPLPVARLLPEKK